MTELASTATTASTEIVFVDSRVPDIQSVLDAIGPNAEIVVIDPSSGGVAQMAEALAGRTGVDAIHIVSHGDAGMLLLGDGPLHAGNLDAHAAALAEIGQALADGGDIHLWGCDVGAGAEGRAFVHALAEATGADIAASIDATGADGDWTLELTNGEVAASDAIGAAELAGYGHDLATFSVDTVAELQLALTTAASNGEADIITLVGDIAASGAGDLTNGYLAYVNLAESHQLTIVGGGHALDANYHGRGVFVSTGDNVEIENLTIRQGMVAGDGGDGGDSAEDALGAGIVNYGSLLLDNVDVTANAASGGGGGGGLMDIYSGGAGGGGGAIGPGVGGDGGSAGPGVGFFYAGSTGSTGTGGFGGSYDGVLLGGRGGSSTGGAGGIGDYGYSDGGSGGTATNGSLSVGAGGGGSGYDSIGGNGGSAAGGIFNAAGATLTIIGTSVISNNLGAGGGGGGGGGVAPYGTDDAGGAGGRGVGAIWNAGTLNITASNFSAMTGNAGASGAGGPEGDGGPMGATPAGVNNIHNLGTLDTNFVVNTAPTQAANTGLTLDEGALALVTATQLEFDDAEQADADITYTVTDAADNGTLWFDLDGSGTVNNAEAALVASSTFTQADINAGELTYLHDGGETTTDSFGFSVSDGTATVVGQSFDITVTSVNDAPTATNLTQSKAATEGGGTVSLDDIVISDVDTGETITATLTMSDLAAGTLTTGTFGSATSTYNAGTGVWTVTGSVADVNAALAAVALTPSSDNDQNFTITTRIRDAADSGPADGAITFDVTPTNDAPAATNLTQSKAATEGGGAVSLDDIVISDVDTGETITATLTMSDPAAGTLTTGTFGSATSTYNAGTGVWTVTGSVADVNAALAAVALTPSSDNDQNFTITTRIRDAADSGPADGAITFDVTPVNDAPIAQDDGFAVSEDGPAISGDLLTANPTTPDADPDGDALTVVEINGQAFTAGVPFELPSGALLTINADGTFDYDPNGAFESLGDGDGTTDSFTYAVTDGSLAQAPGEFDAALELSALDGTNGLALNGVAEIDQSGWSVSAAGDVNGDSIGDLIVGAFDADPNGTGTGASYVVFGTDQGFGAALELSALDGTDGFVLNGAAADDLSGYSVSAAGDVNGDGIGDLIVGAYDADPNGGTSGASYVVFGTDQGFAATLELSALDGSNGFVLNGVVADDHSGYSVSAAGDVNGDGFDDIIVGAYGADPNGSSSGASYVVFGSDQGFGASLELSALDGNNGFVLNGAAVGDESGYQVSAAGDVNGDGIGDLIVGAPSADPGGDDSGASYVVFGSDQGFGATVELSALDGTDGFVLSGVAADDFSGASVSAAGDVNGDGFGDVIVGASGADPNGGTSGASYVVFGTNQGFGASLELSALDGTDGFVLNGVGAGDRSGVSVDGAGDVNGDGIDDLIVGAFGGEPGGRALAGQSYVVFGRQTWTPVVDVATVTVTINGVDDAAVAQDDTFVTDEATAIFGGDLFADNGSGADSDPDDPLSITEVNGSAANVGGEIALASGALLTVNADGTFDYDPNGAFDHLSASGSGGSNLAADDTFTYTLAGGGTATVTVTVTGLDGDDTVEGSGVGETLFGGDGDDILSGFGGDDTLNGEAGDDVLIGGEGADAVSGGDGFDTASYEGSASGVNIVFGGAGTGGDAEGDSLGVERAIGSAHGDSFAIGVAIGFSVAEGLGGADIYYGTSGSLYVAYSMSPEAVTIDLSTGDAAGGHATGDTLDNVTHIIGSAFDDTLTGGSGRETLEGGAGADTLDGGGGASSEASYAGSSAGVTVNLLAGVHSGGDAQGDTLTGFDGVLGSAHADFLTGDLFDNRLSGDDGDDFLNGSVGADILAGGAGDDTLHGGDGADSLFGNPGVDTAIYVNSAAAVSVNLATSEGSGGDAQSDSYSSIEGVFGSVHADTLTGNAGPNTLNGFQGDDLLVGGVGFDTLIGGLGVDTASYAASDVGVTVSITTNLGASGHAVGDELGSIENLIGSDHDDVLIGNAETNTLDGGSGDDNLTGGAGGDTLRGGGGNDTANYSNSAQAVSVSLGGGGAGSGASGDAQGDLLLDMENLFGSSGIDSLIGDEDVNVLNGWQGNDILIGGAGGDTLIGGTGVDNVRYSASTAGVTVNLATTAGLGGDAEGDVLISIESVFGSGHDDVLIGNALVNTLVGRVGDDNLTGGAGADILFGEGGNDTANYANSDAAVQVDLGAGTAAGGHAVGDTFNSIENLFGSSGGDTLTGDGGANTLNGWLGNDTLEGFGGDDTLLGGFGDDVLAGGDDADTLSGGDGNDKLTGGVDADVFFFSTEDFGNDLISDFEEGVDLISMGSTGLTFADFTETEVGGNTILTLIADSTNIITIAAVGNALIDASDFI